MSEIKTDGEFVKDSQLSKEIAEKVKELNLLLSKYKDLNELATTYDKAVMAMAMYYIDGLSTKELLLLAIKKLSKDTNNKQ